MTRVHGVFWLLFAICLLGFLVAAGTAEYLLLDWVPWAKYWAAGGAAITGLAAGFRRGRHWLTQLLYCIALPIALLIIGFCAFIMGLYTDPSLNKPWIYESPGGEHGIVLRCKRYHHIIGVRAYRNERGSLWLDPIDLPGEWRRSYGENVGVKWVSDNDYHIITDFEGGYWQGNYTAGEVTWAGPPEPAAEAIPNDD